MNARPSSTPPAAKRPWAIARLVVRVLALVGVAIVLGGIPASSALRRVVLDRSAPPLVEGGAPRDASLGVLVRTSDAEGGRAIPGARVHVFAMRGGGEGARGYSAGDARTGRDGRARIERMPRGETWITAEAEGRARGSTSLVLDAGDRAIELTLGAEHTLDVVIDDELGAPIEGAEIEVAEADPLPIGARAGRDGIAHATRLGAPPWAVTASGPARLGYDEVTMRGVREGEPLRVVLHKLGAIAVRVVDERGEPAAGARVSVASPALWPARIADADARGAVRIGSLPGGSYALRATSGDRASAIELGVEVVRGQEKSVTLRLAASETVAVRVTGDDDAPVLGARVTLVESGVSPFPIEATTDRGGRARLGPIARGAASLAVRADGFVPRGAIAVPEPLAGEVPIALAHAGAIEGRVVDARGFAIDGATVEIVGTAFDGAPIDDDPRRARFAEAQFASALGGPKPLVSAGQLGVMPGPVPKIPAVGAPVPGVPPSSALASVDEPWVTRADGTYRASPASPGRVRALVHHPQYVDAVSDPVSLAPGATAKLDVVMRAGGTLEGRVIDAGGGPVAGARVVLAATRGATERSARSASDGTFGFASVPGDVVLLVSPDDEGSAVELRATVSVPEGGKKSVTLQLPAARDPLPARVKDDRGYPVDAAQISVVSLDAASALRETAFTDARGEVTLARAKGLPLRAEVSAPGLAPAVVQLDASASSLEVTLAAAESAAGEVRSTRGDPIADAEVVLYTDQGGARRARTASDGRFALADLAAGSGRLVARAAGFASTTRTVTIDADGRGRATSLGRIELAAGGAVEGVVLDARGDPIAGARVARDLVPTYLAVGSTPPGVAVTDARGRFRLADLAEGMLTLEAYAPDAGRARIEVHVMAGETTRDARFTLSPDHGTEAERAPHEPAAAGSLAITLGETSDRAVVVAAVAEGSEAERAGLEPGDAIVSVEGAPVETMEQARARMSGPLGDDVLLKIRRRDRIASLRIAREPVRK